VLAWSESARLDVITIGRSARSRRISSGIGADAGMLSIRNTASAVIGPDSSCPWLRLRAIDASFG
jgi:hypothetical protein